MEASGPGMTARGWNPAGAEPGPRMLPDPDPRMRSNSAMRRRRPRAGRPPASRLSRQQAALPRTGWSIAWFRRTGFHYAGPRCGRLSRAGRPFAGLSPARAARWRVPARSVPARFRCRAIPCRAGRSRGRPGAGRARGLRDFGRGEHHRCRPHLRYHPDWRERPGHHHRRPGIGVLRDRAAGGELVRGRDAHGPDPGYRRRRPGPVSGWTCQGFPTPEVLKTGQTSVCRDGGGEVLAVLPPPNAGPT